MYDDERKEIEVYLQTRSCPYCGNMTMVLVGNSGSLLKWKCDSCNKTGNVGYNLNNIDHVNFSPEKQIEWEKGVDDWHAFIKKWGVRRSKVGQPILINQDESLY